MASTTLAIKDANGSIVGLAVDDQGPEGILSKHIEHPAQRAELLGYFLPLATASKQDDLLAAINTVAFNTSTTGPTPVVSSTLASEATLQQVSTALAGTLAVSVGALPLPVGAASDATLTSLKTALGSPLQAGGSVVVTTSALPTGAATAANQATGNTSLANIATALGGTLAMGAAALPLPAGAATASNQTVGNTSLATIATTLSGTLRADPVVQATATNKGATVGTSAVTLMAANPARRGFVVQNQSATATIYINGLGAATTDNNSLQIGPGGFYESQVHHIGTGAVSVISTAASTPVYAREF